jgi:hypothetical protein
MKPIESYESVRTAVRDLGTEGFVVAVVGAARARRLKRWKDLVEELRAGLQVRTGLFADPGCGARKPGSELLAHDRDGHTGSPPFGSPLRSVAEGFPGFPSVQGAP